MGQCIDANARTHIFSCIFQTAVIPSIALIWAKRDILHRLINIWEVQRRQGEFVQNVEIVDLIRNAANRSRLIHMALAIHIVVLATLGALVGRGRDWKGGSSGLHTSIVF